MTSTIPATTMTSTFCEATIIATTITTTIVKAQTFPPSTITISITSHRIYHDYHNNPYFVPASACEYDTLQVLMCVNVTKNWNSWSCWTLGHLA